LLSLDRARRPAALGLGQHAAKVYRIKFVEDIFDKDRDHVRDLRICDGVLSVRVQQHFVQTPLYRVCADELRSLRGNRVFKANGQSRTIRRSHVILRLGWLVRRSAVFPAPPDAASSRFRTSGVIAPFGLLVSDASAQSRSRERRYGSDCTYIQKQRRARFWAKLIVFRGRLPSGRCYSARKEAEKLDIHLLENDQVVIDGVRFLGMTLWTDFAVEEPTSACGTRIDRRRTSTSSAIEGECSALKLHGKTVVVTHHLPHKVRSIGSFI
jgi:hypothetical protein